jgi:hypothetical protein
VVAPPGFHPVRPSRHSRTAPTAIPPRGPRQNPPSYTATLPLACPHALPPPMAPNAPAPEPSDFDWFDDWVGPDDLPAQAELANAPPASAWISSIPPPPASPAANGFVHGLPPAAELVRADDIAAAVVPTPRCGTAGYDLGPRGLNGLDLFDFDSARSGPRGAGGGGGEGRGHFAGGAAAPASVWPAAQAEGSASAPATAAWWQLAWGHWDKGGSAPAAAQCTRPALAPWRVEEWRRCARRGPQRRALCPERRRHGAGVVRPQCGRRRRRTCVQRTRSTATGTPGDPQARGDRFPAWDGGGAGPRRQRRQRHSVEWTMKLKMWIWSTRGSGSRRRRRRRRLPCTGGGEDRPQGGHQPRGRGGPGPGCGGGGGGPAHGLAPLWECPGGALMVTVPALGPPGCTGRGSARGRATRSRIILARRRARSHILSGACRMRPCACV